MKKQVAVIVLIAAAVLVSFYIGFTSGARRVPHAYDISMYEGVTIFKDEENMNICYIYGKLDDGNISCVDEGGY